MASQLCRHWIGADNSPEAITATLRRFAKGLEPMGDFVNTLEPPATEADSGETLPLFVAETAFVPTLGSGSFARSGSPAHDPIRDFALFGQAECEDQMGSVLTQWRDWIGEPAEMKLAETPPPYKTAKWKQPGKRRH